MDPARALRRAGQIQNRFNVVKTNLAEIALGRFDRLPDQTAGDGGVLEFVKPENPWPAIELRAPPLVLVAGDLGGVREHIIETGIVLATELRKEIVADAVTRIRAVGVRLVLAPADAVLFQPGMDGCAGDVKEGADEAFGGDGPDS